ncbi:MAG TPA: SDR family NAD(P)-dependent oxidoreductase [Acidimicrobiia bacterium]|jgi:NAD(P)-dependent dehydrogenase (short-subunit alcohol dehydrogenase family)|nr:SDR family NAD(P)-dependent oxidoreductase [Acidimicrobiia bacterium]
MSPTSRVAVVTGAAAGIGRAYAERLAVDGLTVAAVDLAPPAETVAAIQGAGGSAAGFAADVTDPDAVSDCVSALTASVGPPAVLVNNVGTYPVISWDDLTLDEFRRVIAINLESAFLLCKACVPSMRELGWGRIVNIASRTFWLPVPDMAAYLASKGGVIGLSRALATELGAHGITVNVVAPGLTRTATMEASTADAVFQMTANMQVIKRTQEPEDLVGVVSFLVSDDAAFMTGQTLMVDGGLIRL